VELIVQLISIDKVLFPLFKGEATVHCCIGSSYDNLLGVNLNALESFLN
jgi:hypothetical protein